MSAMDSSGTGIIFALFFLIALSAFFSACETAFTSLSRVRVKALATSGNRRAELAYKLTERYEDLISTILIGNNIVNILATSLATVVFVKFFGNAGVTISTVVMTVVVLMFGEIAPKSIAKERAEEMALRLARPISFCMTIMMPLVILGRGFQKLIARVVRPAKAEGEVTEEELLTYLEEAENGGSINEHESDLIRSAIEFDDLNAEDILTPRVDVVAVSIDDSPEEIADCLRECGYSRLPVYEGSIDNIIGVLHEKDFFLRAKNQDIRRILTKPMFVLPTVRLSRLLRLLQKTKNHLAVVIDEYGGVQGIVTMEDILEELVGEIWDEHDEVVEEIAPLPDGGYRAAGSANLEKLLELFDRDGEAFESTTVSGWIVEEAGRFPEPGEEFAFDGLKVIVDSIDGHRVSSVRVLPESA